jgi:very-short-patch-repair endonuclease
MEKAESVNLWHYNNNLQKFAKQNRRKMTKAEACIWKYLLSKKQLNGYPFRRQRPVLNYIADFMCKELRLIIEIDGLTHQWENVAVNDQKREEQLKNIGFTVLRFNDNDVLNNINAVGSKIKDIIEEIEKRSL